MSWYMGNTPSVVHDKPLYHGGTRMGLLNQAEGYGAGTYGGLFGDEVVVTSLADTGTGTLRSAIGLGGSAWITFQQGLTAPARSTWAAPDKNAPIGAYTATNIHVKSKMLIQGNTTVDGRGVQYGVEGYGLTLQHGNVIVTNMLMDFSQWWGGGTEMSALHTNGLYNVNDADAAYSYGLQPIQKSVHDTIYAGVYSSTATYSNGDIVSYNGIGYRSIANSNTNHQPDITPLKWAAETPSTTSGAVSGTNFAVFRGTWSSTSTYQLGDGVVFSNSTYISRINSNVNQNPASSGNWSALDPNSNWNAAHTYSAGDYALYSPTGQNVNTFLYISTINSNLNNVPSGATGWVKCGQSGPVNGQMYGNITSSAEMGFWFHHNTFKGPANGSGTPSKGSVFWDFCDDGCAICANNHHVTYSWNHFIDCNKSNIIGCSSTGSTDSGDWITISHNWFQRGYQRQPLARFNHIHIVANYYDQDWSTQTPSTPAAPVEMIAGESSVQILLEGTLGYASVSLANPMNFARTSNANIIAAGHGNAVTGSMTLAADQGTISFTPPYTIALPDLSTGAAQTAFKALIAAAGQQ